MADRIGARGIASELKCLAAATAEIDPAALTTLARLRHPLRSPEALEDASGLLMYRSSGQLEAVHRGAGEDIPFGRHRELLAPATPTGLGVLAVVIRDDEALYLFLLTDEAVFIAAGGGKVKAALKPIQGAKRMACGMPGALRKWFPRDLQPLLSEVNGQPAIVGLAQGKQWAWSSWS